MTQSFSFSIIRHLKIAICFAIILPVSLYGQMGNDNPTGISGIYNGNVTTAGSYDPYTGNATRSVTDLVVPGAVGGYPLAFTRTMNTRYTPGVGTLEFGQAGTWRHNYQWSIDPISFTGWAAYNWMPPSYSVNYPDGRRVQFAHYQGSDPYYRGLPGVSDRFQQLGDPTGGDVYLLLSDGSKVWFRTDVLREPAYDGGPIVSNFTFTFMGLIDPYGQTTTISYGPNSMTVQEPAGRTLTLYYVSTSWNGDTVIDSVVASDGRSVKYNYGGTQPAGATMYTYLGNVQYLDNSGASYAQAIYAYQQSNIDPDGRPLIYWAIDPMYAGPMWAINYSFVPGSSGGVYGQIQSENYLDPATGTPGAAVSTLAVSGNSRTETRGDSPSRTFNYTGGKLTSYTDFKAHGASLSCDANGYVNTTIDQRQNQTDIINEPLTGKATQVTFPLTPPDTVRSAVQREYGSANCPDPNNRDGNNPYFLYRVTNETAHSTIYLRDVNKRVRQINYPDGTYETFSYNDFGQVLTHRMTSGGTETFHYDEGISPPRGLRTSYVPPATPSDPNPENHPAIYHYGPGDRVDYVLDPRGNKTSFQYNPRGQVTRVTHENSGDNSFIQYAYNVDGTLAWTADENHPGADIDPHQRTRYDHDYYKRIVGVTNPLNQTVTYNYALDWTNPYLHTTNSIKYVLSPLNKNVVFDYDENLRKKYQTIAANTDDVATMFFDYDEVGNLTLVRDPRWYVTNSGYITTYGYDERNRRIWMDDPIATDRNSTGHTMNWEYDPVGNKTRETRADGAFRSWDYDIPNRINHVIDWRKSLSDPAITTTYTRDLPDTQNVTVAHTIDAKLADYRFEFDALHRKMSETYPADAYGVPRTEKYWYDAAGNLRLYKNPADKYKHLDYSDSYDSRNRLRHSAWNSSYAFNPPDAPDHTIGQEITTVYDNASRLTSVVTNGGETTVSFGYDDANRQIWEDQTLAGYMTRRISTPRDGDGNRQSIDASGINHLTYQYNERNQLTHILNGSVDPFYDFSYDKAGNETQRQSRVWYTNVANFEYDPLNRVSMGEQGTVNWIFARSHYQYDKAGREVATWRDEDNGLGSGLGEAFEYEPTKQLKKASYNAQNVSIGPPQNAVKTQDYVYTPDRLNRASLTENGAVTSYSMSALNQYQTYNGTTYNYDPNFNLREAPNWWGVFDGESRLTMAGGNGNVVSLTYDGLGRCARRIVYPPGGGSTAVIYVYDGWKPVLEFDAAGDYRASNVYGAGADEILFRWDTVYGGLIYKQDRHGNVVAVLDQWGNIAERYTYDAFGKPKIMSWWDNNERTSSWLGNRFMFQGREYLSELGIYDYRHRHYNPALGRFLQKDPLGFGGGDANLFRYCGGDPVNGSDPAGLAPPPPAKQKQGPEGYATTDRVVVSAGPVGPVLGGNGLGILGGGDVSARGAESVTISSNYTPTGSHIPQSRTATRNPNGTFRVSYYDTVHGHHDAGNFGLFSIGGVATFVRALTAEDLIGKFYGNFGGDVLNTALGKVFGSDANQIPLQTAANAPIVFFLSAQQMAALSGRSGDTTFAFVDANVTFGGDTPNGAMYILSGQNLIGNFRSYGHELGNLLAIRYFGSAYAYGSDQGIDGDKDTGAALEEALFGRPEGH